MSRHATRRQKTTVLKCHGNCTQMSWQLYSNVMANVNGYQGAMGYSIKLPWCDITTGKWQLGEHMLLSDFLNSYSWEVTLENSSAQEAP